MDEETWRVPAEGSADADATQRATSSDFVSPSTPGRRFSPGQLLGGRYRIITKLGAGGMGEVYRAEDTRLGQEVALKFLPLKLSGDASLLERLHAEVRIGRTISHPNVCRIYDIAEAEGQYFIAMEYVSGDNLATLLKRIGRLPGDKAAEIARSLCAGLAAAHAKGILHRDLKPANVMLDGEGEVRVADFGLAIESAAAGDEQVLVGTPAYMAPEQFRGSPATAQSDVYALGLVLYEIFTGKRANRGRSIADIQEQAEGRSIESPSSIVGDIDPAIERTILRCLDPDPAQRPRSVRDVLLALPGGNPLAAALAAGETPSPELVAAAGPQEGMSPRVAWSMLFVIVALYASVIWIAGFTDLHRRVEMRSPQSLREEARELLGIYALRPTRIFSSDGFIQQPGVMAYLEKHHAPSIPAEQLGKVTEFWYLEFPLEARPATEGPTLFVEEDVALASGASLIKLSVDGSLQELRHAPRQSQPAASTTNWRPLFSAAGFDPVSAVSVTPTLFPLYTYDRREAWIAGSSSSRTRIEAASFQGRPTWFKVIRPWHLTQSSRRAQQFGGPLFNVLLGAILIALPTLAFVLAAANVRRRRSDLAGTVRLAVVVAISVFVGFLLYADHVADAAGEFQLVAEAFLAAAGIAVFVSILYLGVEPVIRRRWPELLISWTRMLSSRVRDPLVGRDVLIGVVAGLAHIVATLAASALDQEEAFIRLSFPTGVRTTLAVLIDGLTQGLSTGFLSVMILVVLLLFVRSRRIAMLLHLIIVTLVFLAAYSQQTLPLIPALITSGLLLYVTVKAGPLGVAVKQMVYLFLLRIPAGAAADWQWPVAITSALVIAAVSWYAFRAALGSNPAFRLGVFEDEAAR